ncbi:MAG TPA: DUF4255 domain-containing protein [Burkholderiaceae bacterium]|nr:DUF4255 domain-containing protein [Burkholderiaceae bacterium]
MIDVAISHIAAQLNQSLRRNLQVGEDLVVVSNIVEQDGTLAQHVANKLVVSLVNIERDTLPHRGSAHSGTGLGRLGQNPEPLYLNLLLMFAANFAGGNYVEALKFISATVAFFQGRPVLDHASSPELDARIERLVLEIENLALSDLSNLWSILSGKYVPSVLYRVRMVAVDSSQISGQVSRVGSPRIATGA